LENQAKKPGELEKIRQYKRNHNRFFDQIFPKSLCDNSQNRKRRFLSWQSSRKGQGEKKPLFFFF